MSWTAAEALEGQKQGQKKEEAEWLLLLPLWPPTTQGLPVFSAALAADLGYGTWVCIRPLLSPSLDRSLPSQRCFRLCNTGCENTCLIGHRRVR